MATDYRQLNDDQIQHRRRGFQAELDDENITAARITDISAEFEAMEAAVNLRRMQRLQVPLDGSANANAIADRTAAGRTFTPPGSPPVVDLRTQLDTFTSSPAFEAVRLGGSRNASASFEVQGLSLRAITTGQTSGGAFSQPFRDNREVPLLTEDRRLRLVDVIETRPVPPRSGSSVEYVQDTSAANFDFAREVTEGAAKPEATLTLAVKTASLATIAHWVDATRQVLDDNEQLTAYIRDRLFHGLLFRVDSQIINGNGTAPNLRGILNTTGIGTYAPAAAEARVISIRKATTLTEQAEYAANTLVINPADWELVELSADTQGMFRVSPNVAYSLSPRIWGLQVVVTTAIASGTALVGDGQRGAVLWERQNPMLLTTDSDGSKFLSNVLTILAELRVGLSVTRPTAWTKITFNGTT